jgi:hypothetical protein
MYNKIFFSFLFISKALTVLIIHSFVIEKYSSSEEEGL